MSITDLIESVMFASLFFLLATTLIGTILIQIIQQNIQAITLLILTTLGFGILVLGFTITIIIGIWAVTK